MKHPVSYLLLVALLVTGGRSAAAQDAQKTLTATEKAYVLSKLCTEVKYNFAFYDRLPFDWDSLCVSSLPQLVATPDDDTYIAALQRLFAQLGDGHTYIYAESRGARADWIKPLPMRTKRIGDRVFVTDVRNSELRKRGVERGCEVVRINGMAVDEYVERHKRPVLASSTPQWTAFAPYREFELTKAKGSQVARIEFRDRKGKRFAVESPRNIAWDLPSQTPTFSFEVLPGNIGLLAIRSFMDDDFREAFDALYGQILQTDALIIDLRDNGGGNSAYADYVMRHLTDRPLRQGRWSSPMYVAAHGSWNLPQEWYMETPHDLAPVEGVAPYLRPVAVLVNATTFSSAENFCVTFRGARRGKLIGTPTGGSTGNPILIDAGYGIYACSAPKTNGVSTARFSSAKASCRTSRSRRRPKYSSQDGTSSSNGRCRSSDSEKGTAAFLFPFPANPKQKTPSGEDFIRILSTFAG